MTTRPTRLSLTPLEDRTTPTVAVFRPTGNASPDAAPGTSGLVADHSFGGGGVAALAPSGGVPVSLALPGGGVVSLVGGKLVKVDAAGRIDAAFAQSAAAGLALPGASATALALDPATGTMLVGGTADAPTSFGPPRVFVARFAADGKLDPEFGEAGVSTFVSSEFKSADVAQLLVRPDGRVVAVGTFAPSGAPRLADVAAAPKPVRSAFALQLLPGGAADASFGSGGELTVELPAAGRRLDALAGAALQPGGKLVLAGATTPLPVEGFRSAYRPGAQVGDVTLVRLNADGSVDDSFGAGGRAVPFDSAQEFDARLVAGPGGSLYLGAIRPAGFGTGTLSVAKLTLDGAPDSAYGSGGVYGGPGASALGGFTVDEFGGLFVAVLSNPDAQTGLLTALGGLVGPGGRGEAVAPVPGLTPSVYGPLLGAPVVDSTGLEVIPAQAFAPDSSDSGAMPSELVRVSLRSVRAPASVPVASAATGVLPATGARLLLADFTGDGVADTITWDGPGGSPRVRVRRGGTGELLADFAPFEAGFVGGLNVAVGDLTGDGVPDLAVAPDEGGGPVVAVYDGAKLAAGLVDAAEFARFYGIPDANFRGGARLAVGQVLGDARPDLIVAAGSGGGPRVAVYDGANLLGGPARDFFAFEPTLRNGAFPAAGLYGGVQSVAFGAGAGGAPRVRVYDAALAGSKFADLNELPATADFYAGDPAGRTGSRVALTPEGGGALAVGDAAGAGRVRLYDAAGNSMREFEPLSEVGGVAVG